MGVRHQAEGLFMLQSQQASDYWKANLRVVATLLSVWFVAGFVISIFLIEPLNRIQIGSVGLGFWFAQQASIFVFVVLVLLYAWIMDAVDRRHDVGDRS
jgi:putative solute:sodium symporter small subunit